MPQQPDWGAVSTPVTPPKKAAPKPSQSLIDAMKTAGSGALGQVARTALSFERNAEGIVEPILHPINAIDSARHLASGIFRKAIGRPTGYVTTPESNGEKMLDAMGRDYKTAYATSSGFKDMMRNDPSRPLFDAAGVLSLPFGGEALEARLPSVLSTAAKAARTVTNPVALAGKVTELAGKGTRAAQIAAKGGIGNPATGFSSAALKAVQNATDGRIGADDLANNPAFAQRLADTMQAKGITPGAVKDAILAHHDAPTPRSRITGKPADPEIRGAVEEAVKTGKQAIAEKVGTVPPSSGELGAALDQAVTDSLNNVSHLYNRVMTGPEIFKPQASAVIDNEIDKALKAGNVEDFADFPSRTQSGAAINFLRDKLGSLATNDDLSLPKLEAVRQELNALGWKASGLDSRTIGLMKEGLDNGMIEAAKNGFLKYGDPDNFVNGLRDARAAFQQHKLTFEQPGAIGNAVKQLEKQPGENGLYVPSEDPGIYQKAQDTLVKNILTAKGETKPAGLRLFDQLESVLPTPESLHNVLKDTISQVDQTGEKGASFKIAPGATQKFTGSAIGQNIYTPQEATDLNLGAEARRILDAKPPYNVQEGSTVSKLLGSGKNVLGRAATGYVAGLPWGSGMTGAAVNTILGKIREPSAARLLGRELSGAPNAFPGSTAIENLGTSAQNVSRPLGLNQIVQKGVAPENSTPEITSPIATPEPAEMPLPAAAPTAPVKINLGSPTKKDDEDWGDVSALAPVETAPAGDRPQRATGGKIDNIEHLVTRLMNKAVYAKRMSNSATKPLLCVSDNAIAGALGVAQRAI